MGYRQTIRPNPNIPCKPGWCLAYVNEAFGVPKKYPSATAAWFGSNTKHENRDFPAGVAVPVFYGLDTTPLGHVVIRMPNGSVYSTSDLTDIPHLHPDLADLERYYAYYGMNLTYRGWTEDVEDTPVIAQDMTTTGMAAMGGTITPLSEEDDVSAQEVLSWPIERTDGQKSTVAVEFARLGPDVAAIKALLERMAPQVNESMLNDRKQVYSLEGLWGAVAKIPARDIAAQINAAGIAAEVRDELVKLIGGK